VAWLPENYLEPLLVAEGKLQYLGLHAHLTSIVSIFLLGYFKTSEVENKEELWRQIQQFDKLNKKYTRKLPALQDFFYTWRQF
jgi:hypothetical protein